MNADNGWDDVSLERFEEVLGFIKSELKGGEKDKIKMLKECGIPLNESRATCPAHAFASCK